MKYSHHSLAVFRQLLLGHHLLLLLEDLQLTFLEFDLEELTVGQSGFEEEEDVSEALPDVGVGLGLEGVFVFVEVYEVECEMVGF
jgi:hypothetical protein